MARQKPLFELGEPLSPADLATYEAGLNNLQGNIRTPDLAPWFIRLFSLPIALNPRQFSPPHSLVRESIPKDGLKGSYSAEIAAEQRAKSATKWDTSRPRFFLRLPLIDPVLPCLAPPGTAPTVGITEPKFIKLSQNPEEALLSTRIRAQFEIWSNGLLN